MEKYFLVSASLIAAIAAVNDVRKARIPNWLTYGGLAAALVARAATGWQGLLSGLAGSAIAGGVFFLLFMVGGMGGGDMKLMAAMGAWVGTAESVPVLFTSAIAGGILALFYMLFSRRVVVTLRNSVALIHHHLAFRFQPHPFLNVQESGALRIPYGLAIAIGTLYCAGSAFLRG